MEKFVILTYGFTPPTDEVQRAWGEWFTSVGPRLVDPGSSGSGSRPSGGVGRGPWRLSRCCMFP